MTLDGESGVVFFHRRVFLFLWRIFEVAVLRVPKKRPDAFISLRAENPYIKRAKKASGRFYFSSQKTHISSENTDIEVLYISI